MTRKSGSGEVIGLSMVEQAKALLAGRRFEQAETKLLKLIGKNPANAEVLNLLGVSRELQGQLQKAAQFYRSALCFSSGYTAAQQNLHRVTRWPYLAGGVERDLVPMDEKPGQA